MAILPAAQALQSPVPPSLCARHGAQRHAWRWQPGSESEPGSDVEGGSPSGGLGDRNPEPNSKGVRREAESEGSCKQSPGPRNTKRLRGGGGWARGQRDSKPDVIRTQPTYMRRVYGTNVTRLTLGDLPFCPCGLGPSQGDPRVRQKSAEAIRAGVHPAQGRTGRAFPARSLRCPTAMPTNQGFGGQPSNYKLVLARRVGGG
jgi:hypothetical protein